MVLPILVSQYLQNGETLLCCFHKQLVSCILSELRGIYGSVMTSMVDSEVPQGIILLHTPGTQGSVKHSELFSKGKYLMDLTGEVCVITGSMFNSWQAHFQ